jgi:hypothetical protein
VTSQNNVLQFPHQTKAIELRLRLKPNGSIEIELGNNSEDVMTITTRYSEAYTFFRAVLDEWGTPLQ